MHINTISLGAILTDRIRHKLANRPETREPLDLLARESELNALGRHGHPGDAACLIAQMLGPAANHLTETNLSCDGGYTRHYG